MLKVEIDGETHALTDCCWIQLMPCGCITAALTAALPDSDLTCATEEQAHKELAPTKRERDKDKRQGLTLQLMTFDKYRSLKGRDGDNGWFCSPAHREDAESRWKAKAAAKGDG